MDQIFILCNLNLAAIFIFFFPCSSTLLWLQYAICSLQYAINIH